MMPDYQPSPTLTVDDPDNAGSAPGNWATALAHTHTLHVVDCEPSADASDPDGAA